MAMFLSRLKQILNLGTKSITANGTYMASSDGYDGYSQVSVNMPSVTPSNSTPAALTSGNAVTPTANGYVIESYNTKTPSNSSPVALTSGEIDKIGGNGYAIESYNTIIPPAVDPERIEYGKIYQALDDGYAIGYLPIEVYPSNEFPDILQVDRYYQAKGRGYLIESYDNIIPSSTPKSVSSGDMVHVNGSGVIVDNIPTPTSLTPSDSSPATITSGETYTATANGKAISSLSEVAPSNANPPYMFSGSIYKITTRRGYLISTVNIVLPSDSNPPLLSNDNSWYQLNGASGYLYATQQPKVAVGTFTNSSSALANVTVDIGFQPKYLCVWYASSIVLVYDERHNSGESYFRTSSTPSFDAAARFNQSSVGNTIQSITSTGFIVRSSANRTWRYFAIG